MDGSLVGIDVKGVFLRFCTGLYHCHCYPRRR